MLWLFSELLLIALLVLLLEESPGVADVDDGVVILGTSVLTTPALASYGDPEPCGSSEMRTPLTCRTKGGVTEGAGLIPAFCDAVVVVVGVGIVVVAAAVTDAAITEGAFEFSTLGPGVMMFCWTNGISALLAVGFGVEPSEFIVAAKERK